jgi:hypothetical protein
MRTENQSSRIVDQAETRIVPDFSRPELRPLYLKPIKVDKQRTQIKKVLKRYENIVSELKMLLDMKAKDRKMIAGLISRWLKTLE